MLEKEILKINLSKFGRIIANTNINNWIGGPRIGKPIV